MKPLLVATLVSAHLLAQIEELPIASGPPGFGEQPWIRGNLIVWQRWPVAASERGRIQVRDISRMDNPVIGVVEYPVSRGGVVVSSRYLFRGTSNGFPNGSPVLARDLADLGGRGGRDILVSNFGAAVAATDAFVFIRVEWYEPVAERSHILAAPVDALGASGALRVVTRLGDERRQASLSRMEAASERYFVWQDRDPDVPRDSWKIYAKRTEDLFVPDAERLVVDTEVSDQPPTGHAGVYIALHDTILITQAAEENRRDSSVGIYLVDLEAHGPPVRLAEPSEPRVELSWPSVSAEYAVWTRLVGFFERTPYAVRLEAGRPVGQSFPISSRTDAGSWITIDRNIAVWNGRTDGVVSEAIVAAELPLPGAEDVGDVDQNGQVNLTDAVIVLNYVYRGSWKPRRRLADIDQDGLIGLEDALAILRYLFSGDGTGALGGEAEPGGARVFRGARGWRARRIGGEVGPISGATRGRPARQARRRSPVAGAVAATMSSASCFGGGHADDGGSGKGRPGGDHPADCGRR